MHKPRAEPRISPRNRKISRLFNEQPAEDRDPIALRDLPGAAVRTVVGARPAGDPTIVVMAILGHIGGAGAIVGGKPELLEVREAASVGGLFILECAADVMSASGTMRRIRPHPCLSASLIGRLGSSTFRLSTTAVSMSLTGSRFSSESAPRPFHHGIRRRGGTIYWAALPSV